MTLVVPSAVTGCEYMNCTYSFRFIFDIDNLLTFSSVKGHNFIPNTPPNTFIFVEIWALTMLINVVRCDACFWTWRCVGLLGGGERHTNQTRVILYTAIYTSILLAQDQNISANVSLILSFKTKRFQIFILERSLLLGIPILRQLLPLWIFKFFNSNLPTVLYPD